MNVDLWKISWSRQYKDRNVAIVWSRINAILAVIVVISVLWCLWQFPATVQGVYPRCPFYLLTGYYCPGCGSLRSISALLHGHFLHAFKYNPLCILAVPLLVVWSFERIRHTILGGPKRDPALSVPALRYLWILILGFAIIRNLPWPPFNYLAP